MFSIRKNLISTTLLVFLQFSYSQNNEGAFPFNNSSLSLEVRVNDLIERMTLEEKTSQMLNDAPAIKRLKIPAYNWWNECLHGVGRSGFNVTVFPQAIGLAATFDDDALKKMGDITSDEARAIYNESNRSGKGGAQYRGLTFWTPNINIFRDPRWGRGQETYGEDPYLTARMGTAIVKGLQGNDPNYLKVSACAKHFAVHSGPEPGRNMFNVAVDPYDLWDTYLPAFRSLIVDAKVSGVMCAYNRFQGQPCCGNDLLMNNILRNQWNFKGYVTSDCGAIEDFYNNHKTHANAADAAADAVLHGTDLECGVAYHALMEAIKNKSITEKDIDISLKRLFAIRFRLGMFDAEKNGHFDNIPISNLESKEHQLHALKMARESMVLLKNNKNILPLANKFKRILVIGPNANNEETLLGNYNGKPSNTITPLVGLKSKQNIEVVYKKGTDFITSKPDEVQDALSAVKSADLVIFVGGISPRLEGESGDAGNDNPDGFYGGDRTNISLPKVQTELMKQIKIMGVPLVFVCMSGSAVGFEWEAENADAIIQAWYGGQSAGTAIADILMGDYNPSGRLPVTFYKNTNDLPAMEDYSMSNRTYRYYKGDVLYPFGFGLSYTKFNYSWKNKPLKTYSQNDTIQFSVQVSNKGKLAGDEIVQAYIQYPNGDKLPLKELRQFNRLNIEQGTNQMVNMDIPVNSLLKWSDEMAGMRLYSGEYKLKIGSHSSDQKLCAKFKIN